MFPYSFEVVYSTGVGEYERESGMGLANSFTEAAKTIEDYYGLDLQTILNLTLYEENSLILLPQDVIKKYEQEEYISYYSCNIHGNPI